jgi:hypothetical protein
MNLLWKEWRQQRMFLLGGALLGFFFPLLNAFWTLNQHQGFHTGMGAMLVICIGSFFALILGVSTAADDLRPGISTFWQSRTVSIRKLLTTKLLVGAAVLLIAFLITESLDFITSQYLFVTDRAWQTLTLAWPVAVMIFSVTVFLLVLICDSAKAILLAIWFGLLFYFLPLVLPGLGWINFFERVQETYTNGSQSHSLIFSVLGWENHTLSLQWRLHFWYSSYFHLFLNYLIFLGTTMFIALGSLICSIQAIKRQWRWDPGQKTIAWLLGLSSMFIFGLSMFQIGHNLQPLTTYQGKTFVPSFNFYDVPEETIDWLDPKIVGSMLRVPSFHSQTPSKLAVHGEVMCKVSLIPDGHYTQNPPLTRYDWWFDLYQFPAAEKPARHLSRTRFFSTPALLNAGRQYIAGCFIKDNTLFIAGQYALPAGKKDSSQKDLAVNILRFWVTDISNPAWPKLIADRELLRTGQSDERHYQRYMECGTLGNYCYIGRGQDLVIISVARPDQPKIIKTIPFSSFKLPEYRIPNTYIKVQDDKLICSSYNCILILDLSNPESPRNIFFTQLGGQGDRWLHERGTVTFSNDLLYLARDSGLTVYRLNEGSGSQEIGGRLTSPLERLTGRYSEQLLVYQGKLFEAADRFGLLVYDISNPTAPKRIFHGGEEMDFVTTVGKWNDLLYIASPDNSWAARLTFLNIPASK